MTDEAFRSLPPHHIYLCMRLNQCYLQGLDESVVRKGVIMDMEEATAVSDARDDCDAASARVRRAEAGLADAIDAQMKAVHALDEAIADEEDARRARRAAILAELARKSDRK